MGCYPGVTLVWLVADGLVGPFVTLSLVGPCGMLSQCADGLVGPYETSLQIDSDQEEAGAPMGLVTTSRPVGSVGSVGSVGTFPSSDSIMHSFAEQWEDGSSFLAEAEEDMTGSCILTEDSSCGDYKPITEGPVGSSFTCSPVGSSGMFPFSDSSMYSPTEQCGIGDWALAEVEEDNAVLGIIADGSLSGKCKQMPEGPRGPSVTWGRNVFFMWHKYM